MRKVQVRRKEGRRQVKAKKRRQANRTLGSQSFSRLGRREQNREVGEVKGAVWKDGGWRGTIILRDEGQKGEAA